MAVAGLHEEIGRLSCIVFTAAIWRKRFIANFFLRMIEEACASIDFKNWKYTFQALGVSKGVSIDKIFVWVTDTPWSHQAAWIRKFHCSKSHS